MSHFSNIRTRIVDRDALVSALEDLGYSPTVYDVPVPLEGYRGDARDQRAHVVVPRRQVGRLSNDLGFERDDDGTFRAWISDYDSRKHNAKWMNQLTQKYAYRATVSSLERQRFDVVEQQQAKDGTVRLVVRRFS